MGSVEVDRDAIVPHDGVLPILRLGERTRAGADHVLGLADRLTSGGEHRRLSESATGVYQDRRLVAFADTATGQARMFPRLELLTPGGGLAGRAREAALDLAGDAGLFPEDRTGRQVLDPTVLRGSRASRRRVGDAAEHLAVARIRRDVDGIPVVGKGSQATIAVSADGVEAVTHTWRAAEVVDEVPGSDIDPDRITELIAEDLRTAAEDKDLRVQSAELVYHDGDGDVLQPVFRYRATYGGGDEPIGRLLGYVPAVRLFDDLRVAVPVATTLPTDSVATRRPRIRDDAPVIGRYVVRQDNAGWVASANGFLDGLRAAQLLDPSFRPVDRQYYWAEPRLFTDENHAFVDGVQVALTEVHGNPGRFWTLRNDADRVDLDEIPADGYGGADRDGALAYWILHSCAVIPTSADHARSYDVWWSIFNGLHAALGYRTKMWINDEITGKFAFWAGLGAPMISNWLTTIIDDDSYSPTDTVTDTGFAGFFASHPMGRPAAVTVLGHSDDTIFDTSPLSRPSVLQQWWFDD